MDYCILSEVFYNNKNNLDGYIFYKIEENFIFIRQVVPNRKVRKFLINNSIKFMTEQKAKQIWDYIDSHKNDTKDNIARACSITEDKALEYVILWAVHNESSFIQELTNSKN